MRNSSVQLRGGKPSTLACAFCSKLEIFSMKSQRVSDRDRAGSHAVRVVERNFRIDRHQERQKFLDSRIEFSVELRPDRERRRATPTSKKIQDLIAACQVHASKLNVLGDR